LALWHQGIFGIPAQGQFTAINPKNPDIRESSMKTSTIHSRMVKASGVRISVSNSDRTISIICCCFFEKFPLEVKCAVFKNKLNFVVFYTTQRKKNFVISLNMFWSHFKNDWNLSSFILILIVLSYSCRRTFVFSNNCDNQKLYIPFCVCILLDTSFFKYFKQYFVPRFLNVLIHSNK
jgi:hypothetical protein